MQKKSTVHGSKPTILICNDDGITALGIRSLVEVAQNFGEVIVVAPDSPQSAQGHSITIEDPIRIHSSDIFGSNVKAFECSGFHASTRNLEHRCTRAPALR